MREPTLLPDDQLNLTDVIALIETLETRLRAAEMTIATLNDRLAWAEAELAEQAQPFAPSCPTGALTVIAN